MKAKLARLSQYPAPIRIGVFVLILLALWLPFAIPLYQVVKDPNLVSIVTMLILYGQFVVLIQIWGKQVYHQPNLLQRYGLVLSRRSGLELLEGFAIGCASCFILFGAQTFLGWAVWQPASTNFLRILLEGLLIAFAVCFAEELVFRGWLLDELQRDYSAVWCRWLNAGIFASLHFVKPIPEIIRTLPQFPGLLLLGLTLIWAKRIGRDSPISQINRSIYGRLSLPIGLHAGLVWSYYLVKVGQLSHYTGQVPEWVTGIDGNPLAGLLGLGLMTALVLAMRQLALTVSIKPQ